MSQDIDLDTTLAALGRDLKSIPTEEALAIIDTWASQLTDTEISEDLRQLKAAINSGGKTDISLSEVLIDLGANTAAASSEVGDDETIAAKIQDIATLLSEAGNALR